MELAEFLMIHAAMILAALVIIPFHEFAHAFAAVKSGDRTPIYSGRYTLNPLKHFDIYGLLMFALVGFGWAKPVPVDPRNFRSPRKNMFFVAIAGVVTNYILAFLIYPLFILIDKHMPDLGLLDDFFYWFFRYAFMMNLAFFAFNLLPIYPLDGFRVVESFSRTRNGYLRFMYRYGMYILIGLLLLGFLGDMTGIAQLDVLGNFMSFCVDTIGWPITKFWGLFF